MGAGRRLKPCGTEAAYQRHVYHGDTPCRRCREAHARFAVQRRAAAVAVGGPPVHGFSGYVNYGCRCGVCSGAKAAADVEYRRLLRERGRVLAGRVSLLAVDGAGVWSFAQDGGAVCPGS